MHNTNKNQGGQGSTCPAVVRKGGVDVRNSNDPSATWNEPGFGEASHDHESFDSNTFQGLQAMNDYAQTLRERSTLSPLYPTNNTQIGIFPTNSPSLRFIMGVDQMSAVQMAEHILKEYRTLDCSCCNNFFGYMHRQTGAIYCSSTCLTTGSNNPTGHTVPFGHPVLPALTPLTPQQILAVTNHVGHSETNGVVHPPQPQVPTKETTQCRESVAQKVAQFSVKKEVTIPEVTSSRESGNEVIRSRRNKAEDTDSVDHGRPSFMAKEIRKVTRVYTDDKTTPFIPKGREERKVNKEEVDGANSRPVLAKRNPFVKEKTESPVEINPFGKPSAETPVKKPVAVPESKNINKAKEVTSSKPPASSQETPRAKEEERNPFVKKKAVADTPPPAPTIREISVTANSIALKLRSALPFSNDPDEFIGRPMLGGKCNDNGPVDFFFQSASMAKKLATLQSDINNFGATATAIPVQKLELGQLVFAPYGEELFRGEIIGIPKPDLAEVFYVDYGNSMQVQKNELSALPKEFFDVPRLCFHCQWDFWLAKDPNEELAEVDANRYHSTENKGIMPLMKIGDGQYIVSIGPKVENVKFTVKPFPKVERVPMKVERPLPPFKSAPVAQPAAQQRKKIMFKDCEYSPLLQDGNNVKVSYAWDTIKYLIISPDDEDAIFNLQTMVNESIESAKMFKSLPDVGEVVLAPYLQEFYRAKVVSHEPGDKVKVMFFDFGDTMTVNFGELFEPSDEVMKYPIYAMDVQLDGVPEVRESVTLDSTTNALLASTMQLQIKKRPEGDSDVFFVTLWKENETLNRIIKRTILNAVEQELLEAEDRITNLHFHKQETYLDRLCRHNDFTRSLLENMKKVQTDTMYLHSVTNDLPFTYKWSAYDTQFDYFENDVSLLPMQGIVDFTIIKYRHLDRIYASPQSEDYELIRESLSDEILDYVNKVNLDATFEPKRNQVCLVKLPTWSERSAILIQIHGHTWLAKNNHLLDKTDGRHVGRWHRGLFKMEQQTETTTYYGFEFCDIGKFCFIPRRYMHKSPLRFVVAPIIRATLVILWNETIQMTKKLDLALEYVMKPGLKLKALIVAEHDDISLVRLLEPDEKKIVEQGFALLQRDEENFMQRVKPKPTKQSKVPCPKSLRISFDEPGLVPDRYVVNAGFVDDEAEESEDDLMKFFYGHYCGQHDHHPSVNKLLSDLYTFR